MYTHILKYSPPFDLQQSKHHFLKEDPPQKGAGRRHFQEASNIIIRGPESVVRTHILSVAVCCSVLQRVAVCCSVLQCAAVCCSVLHRVLYFQETDNIMIRDPRV